MIGIYQIKSINSRLCLIGRLVLTLILCAWRSCAFVNYILQQYSVIFTEN